MVDLVEIIIEAGTGGSGTVSFQREKFKPKGPPDGGDGGTGGDVYLVADVNLSTLYDFRLKHIFKAENGKRGGRNNKRGKSGSPLYLKVPVGTEVYLDTKTKKIADLVNHGEQLLVARGGERGRGNAKLRTSKNRIPRYAEEGKKGEKKKLVLELKLIADIGIVGLPNAGKSTLLNALTRARAKIGSYPFTTLSPNLGVMKLASQDLVIADIPGLIEGASKGKGLGDQFLRHIERTKILVHLIDPLPLEVGPHLRSDLIRKNYKTIREELGEYSPKLLLKPEIVAINKLDLEEASKIYPDIRVVFEREGLEVIGISALTSVGLGELKARIVENLEKKKVPVAEIKLVPTFTIDDLPNKKIIFKDS